MTWTGDPSMPPTYEPQRPERPRRVRRRRRSLARQRAADAVPDQVDVVLGEWAHERPERDLAGSR